jgi:hypothetical protein
MPAQHHSGRQWNGSHLQAAYRRYIPFHDVVKEPVGNKGQCLAAKKHLLAVDVKAARFAAGQGELAKLHSALAKKFRKPVIAAHEIPRESK